MMSADGDYQIHRVQDDVNSRLDSMAEAFESSHADDEAAAIAAERIRSGAAEHKEDGAEALRELGILRVHREAQQRLGLD